MAEIRERDSGAGRSQRPGEAFSPHKVLMPRQKTGGAWKAFTEGLGGAGAKIPRYSFALFKNALAGVGGVILPGWTMKRVGWVAGAGFVLGFFVGKRFGGVHVHLTAPSPSVQYYPPPHGSTSASSSQ